MINKTGKPEIAEAENPKLRDGRFALAGHPAKRNSGFALNRVVKRENGVAEQRRPLGGSGPGAAWTGCGIRPIGDPTRD